MRRSQLFCTSAFLLVSAMSTVAHAQATAGDGVNAAPAAPAEQEGARAVDAGDIVVTARRSAENLQTVPVAVTVLSDAALTKSGGISPLDLGQIAPGIRTAGNVGSRSDVVYSIRGQSVTFGNIFPAVIPYFAEVPIVGEFSTGSYFDLENVQILRGPQGVRFGRVTDGGAVLLSPKKPTNEFGGFLDVSTGNYGLLRMTGAVNLPIVSDKILLRVAGERNRRDGFTTNVLTDSKLDNTNYDTIRASLTIRPFEGLENNTVFQYNEAHETNSNAIIYFNPAVPSVAANLAAYQAALTTQQMLGPRKVQNGNAIWGPNFGLFGNRRQTILSNSTTLDITDNINLRNIFGYITTKKYAAFDYDGSPVSRVDTFSDRAPRVNMKHISDEIQLNGLSFDALKWSIGAYFDKQSPNGAYEQTQGSFTPAGGYSVTSNISLQTTTSTAFYGNAELDLGVIGAEGLKISGGLRHTKDTTEAANRGRTMSLAAFLDPANPAGQCTAAFPCQTFKSKGDILTYEAGVSYEISRGAFTYVTYRKGYRPGGINTSISSLDPTGQYAAETNNELEIGVKLNGHLGEARYRLNIAAFSDDYKGLQKRINYTDPNTGALVTSILNATDAKIKGIEVESSISIPGGLDIGLNAALTDAKYKKGNVDRDQLFNPVNGACNNTVSLNVGFCPLHKFALTPKFQGTATIGYSYELPDGMGDIRFGFDVYHQSSMAYSDVSVLAPLQVGPGYTLANFNLTWKRVAGQALDLSAFVTNLTDKVYRQGVSCASQRASAGTCSEFYGAPRMFGVSARIGFGGE